MTRSTFRAAVVQTPEGPDSIEIVDVPLTEPAPGQVRVSVAAAPVNPVDLGVVNGVFHARGLIHQPERTGLGWEFAGSVDAIGPGVDVPLGVEVAGLIDGFDRDFGTYAEYLVISAADIAPVPDGLDLIRAATVPLNGLAAMEVLDLLGDAPVGANRLLVTGAAGSLGGYLLSLAPGQGWDVTGLARTGDEAFVRSLGVAFIDQAESGWDAVADAAVLQQQALALVRDGGKFVGVQPGNEPASERDITVTAIVTRPDGSRLAGLLARAAYGRLPTRVRAVLPLEQAGDAHRAMANGGVRGRFVLTP
ncbi:MAG TPA: NADP-dependent oxidoreductase [Acidimicrobiales bacterium]|nr:NADP-dependent oxidoreductase [Acidimicrobiales bacterium]